MSNCACFPVVPVLVVFSVGVVHAFFFIQRSSHQTAIKSVVLVVYSCHDFCRSHVCTNFQAFGEALTEIGPRGAERQPSVAVVLSRRVEVAC